MDNIEDVLRGEFDLDIPNFKKWNPDTRSRRAWFALSVDWADDPKVCKLTASDERCWLRILTFRARSHQPLTNITTTYLQHRINIQGRSMRASLLKLVKLGLIEVRRSSLQDITIQDRQTDGEVGNVVAGLSPDGVAFFRKKLGPRFEDELQKCRVYWEAFPAHSRKPFPVVFTRWVDRLGKGAEELDFSEICT